MDNNNKIVDLILDSIHELRDNTNKRLDDIEKKIDKGFGETVSLKDCATNQTNLKQNISKENIKIKKEKQDLKFKYIMAVGAFSSILSIIVTKIFN